jgi:hypothetical protein
MTINNFYKGKDIFDHKDRGYSICDICKSNGYPNEKVVYQLEGFRSENEEGFIFKFTVYNYSADRRTKNKHEHKYNQKLIDQLLHHALKERHATERLT